MVENQHTPWKTLYKLGGAAILLEVIVFRRYLGVEILTFNGFGIFTIPKPVPSQAVDWFQLLQKDRIVGLALLDITDLISYALVGITFLALYAALRETNQSLMLVAVTTGTVGTAVYFASNQAIGLLHLSEKYATAETELQRSLLQAAGEALLAEHQGTGMYCSLFLVLLAGLLISIVMLQSGIFGRATGVIGILANSIGLTFFITLVFLPEMIWLPPSLSALFRVTWYILIAIKLFKLGK